MKIDGIGEHVGYEKVDIVRDVDTYFMDDNERCDIFGDNELTIDEDAPLTFFSGDDASLISFTVTIHFLDRSFLTFEFVEELFKAGIPDITYLHTWEWKEHLCGLWFEFEGDFNGGFPALDRFVKVAEMFKLTYEYTAQIIKDANGKDVPCDGNDIITYRSPFFSGDGTDLLTIDDVDALIAKGLIAPFTVDKVKVRDENGNVITYGEYRKSHQNIIEI